MEFYQLRYFMTVAKWGNISKAAQDLHMSQPSVSKAIHALEAELDVQLLERRGRNVALTHEGQLFRQKLTPVLGELNAIKKEMVEAKLRTRETIRFNILSTAPIISRIISEFKKENPDVRFLLHEEREMTQWDICIRSSVPDISYSNSVKLMDEAVGLAVNKNSPLAAKDFLTLDDLKNQPFIILKERTSLRSIQEKCFGEIGFIPNIVYECDTPHLLRYLIKDGLGVAFYPERSWGGEESRKAYDTCLKKIEGLNLQRSLYLVRHNDRSISDSAERFWDFLIDYFAKNYSCNE